MVQKSFRRFVLPEIVFGIGALGLTGRYAKGFDAARALLVSDPGVEAAGWTAKVAAALIESGVEPLPFLGVSPNPRDHEADAALQLCLEKDCDLVVAVGGGSPMDLAKAVSICATNGGSILAYEGVDRVPLPGLPLICVPTTAGTSADVSQFAIINDTVRRVKIAIVSKKTVPDAALIDPMTTTTMPPALVAATGMDALCHASEAFVSLGASPLTDLPALEAARLVGRNLVAAHRAALADCGPDAMGARMQGCEDVEDCRRDMMLASLLAGEAFSNASLGLVHAMAHALGGLLDAPHGLCNALLLDHVALANAPVADAAYGRLATAIREGRAEAAGSGQPLPVEGSGAQAFAAEIRSLRAELGITQRLSDLGASTADLAGLADFAERDPCMATNPRRIGKAEIAEIYAAAL
jgi:alcohol dehydrogenase class IV